jgi:hypothetical protein
LWPLTAKLHDLRDVIERKCALDVAPSIARSFRSHLRRDIAGSRSASAPLERPAGFAYAAGCNDLASETFLFRTKT